MPQVSVSVDWQKMPDIGEDDPHRWRGDASDYQEIELCFVHNRIADKCGVRAENSLLLTQVR